jgi:hypothetical protein
MHELWSCEAGLRQVLDLVPPPGAGVIGRITRRIGPLAASSPTSYGLPSRWWRRARYVSAR